MSNELLTNYQGLAEKPDSYNRMNKLFAIKNEPHGWIQWKGTEVCMDIKCECGAHLHADAMFLYFLKCKHCDRAYRVSPYVHLMELTPAERTADEKVWDKMLVLEDQNYEPAREVRKATGD